MKGKAGGRVGEIGEPRVWMGVSKFEVPMIV